MLKESPYWWVTAPELPSYAERSLPTRVDVAVVGGGYTGLSAACRLAQAGTSVAVLEKETIGWGASSRNGGQVLAGLKKPPATLVSKYGLDIAKRLFAASVKSIDYVEELIEAEQIDCEFVRCGSLGAASKPTHFENYKERQELLARDFDYHVELVPRAEQQSELGTNAYYGLLVDPHNGALHPAHFVRGLAQAAERAGANLHERTAVMSIDRVVGNAAGFEVVTSRGTLRADEVFVATNGYTDAATPFLRRRAIPIGSYIIATEVLKQQIADRILPRRRVVADSKQFLHYFRLSSDNRMIFGGRGQFVPSTARSTRRSAAILQRDMVRIFPELHDVKVNYIWSGNVCFSMDMMPHAGQSGDGLHYAMSYGGHGVAMATYMGYKMAGIILKEDDDNPFGDIRFSAIPLYNGWPWFLPFAGLWFKLLDWIG